MTSLKLKTFAVWNGCQENEKSSYRLGRLSSEDTSDKGLVYKLYKNFLKLINKTTNKPI